MVTTKTELERLPALKTEIRLLQEELKNLPLTKDSVKGSMPEHPYIQVTVPIKGVNLSLDTKLRAKLAIKLDELQAELARMEDWLDGVEDPEMRTILRLRYRNEMKHEEIGKELGYSERTIKRKLHEFWKVVL